MENDFNKKLDKYRKEIDKIDRSIVDFLNKRAKSVSEIKKMKVKKGVHLYNARREEKLMENIAKYNKGPLYNDNIIQIFECILRNVQILEKDENL